MATSLRSLIFWIFLIVSTVIITILGAPSILFAKADAVAAVFRFWAALNIKALQYICGLSFRITGAENLPKGGFIVASKHQSAWETIFLFLLAKKVVFIVKKELTYIPFYGQYIKYGGMIPIKRESGVSAIKVISKHISDAAKQNKVIVIFPEGTRTLPFQRVPYKPGIALINNLLPDVPIVPVALNSGLFWAKGSLIIKQGVVDVSILPPLQGKFPKRELVEKLQNLIDNESDKLLRN